MHIHHRLCSGSEKVEQAESHAERYARSASADAVFATARGKIKPGKQLLIGMGLKSMTGKRTLVDVFNCFFAVYSL